MTLNCNMIVDKKDHVQYFRAGIEKNPFFKVFLCYV